MSQLQQSAYQESQPWRNGITPTPWRVHELVTIDGIRFRVAESMADAIAIRSTIREAWGINDSAPYFYSQFDNTETIYRTYIAPSLETVDIRQLPGLCLVAEARNEIIATMTLVFDHQYKLVEYGRGAAHPKAQGLDLVTRMIAYCNTMLNTSFRAYSLVADCTTLIRSLADKVSKQGIPPVALHPSSFVVQQSCVPYWRNILIDKMGIDMAMAVMVESPLTGLGRFATTYHLSLSRNLTLSAPALSSSQKPFYDYTMRTLAIERNQCVATPVAVKPHMSQLVAAGTRTLTASDVGLDPSSYLNTAVAEGIETVIVRLPCTAQYRPLSQRLDQHGILSGVYPNGYGTWLASYTLAAEGATQVRHNLQTLIRREAFRSALPLARLVVNHIDTHH